MWPTGEFDVGKRGARISSTSDQPHFSSSIRSFTEWTKEPALPATPSYFRLLYLGRLLADEQTLSGMFPGVLFFSSYLIRNADSHLGVSIFLGLGLKLEPNVTIVHLSVRTFPISEDGEYF